MNVYMRCDHEVKDTDAFILNFSVGYEPVLLDYGREANPRCIKHGHQFWY